MGKLTYIILSALLLSSIINTLLFAKAQKDTIINNKPIKTIEGSFKNMAQDDFGNVYLATSDNKIIKYNSRYDSLYAYPSKKSFGDITLIDATNPLKILIYYQDYGKAVFLDASLNELVVIGLRENNINPSMAAATSFDNQLWVLDEWDNKIKKIDDNGQVQSNNIDLRFIPNHQTKPELLADRNQQLYLYDKETGWLIFNRYGALLNTLEWKNWADPQVTPTFLEGRQANKVLRYSPKNDRFDTLVLPNNIKDAQKILAVADKCLVLEKDKLVIFQIIHTQP